MTLNENPYLVQEESWTDDDWPLHSAAGALCASRTSPAVRVLGGSLRSVRRPGAETIAFRTADRLLSTIDVLLTADAVVFAGVDRSKDTSPGNDSDAVLRAQFQSLAKEWKRETRIISSMDARLMHRAYQRIIGLGPAVVPFIVEDMEGGGRHWSWAMMALTGEDVARDAESPAAAAEAWIAWYRSQQYASAR